MCAFFYLTLLVIKTCLIADTSALLILFPFVNNLPKAEAGTGGAGEGVGESDFSA